MWNTLTGLSHRGHHVTFIAPDLRTKSLDSEEMELENCRSRLVGCRPGRLIPSVLRALATGRPLSILRHTHRALRNVVKEEIARGNFDIVHGEQVQSVFNIPEDPLTPPVVLRAQNVESHLWRMVARTKPSYALMARREARKMAVTEAQAIQGAAATVVLTRRDGLALAGGVGMQQKRVHHIPPPFPAKLPGNPEILPGDPAIFLLGGGWLPNRDSITWFFDSIWGSITEALPKTQVHVFGEDGSLDSASISWHPSPDASSKLFHQSSVLIVPLRVASGIRMKILEAWSRGTPVIATPEAVEGLDAKEGNDVLLARNGPEFAAALTRLHTEEGLRQRIVDGGRQNLTERHDPDETCAQLEGVYREAIGESGSGL